MIFKVIIFLLAFVIATPTVSAASTNVKTLKEQKSQADRQVANTNKKLKAAQREAKKSLSA